VLHQLKLLTQFKVVAAVVVEVIHLDGPEVVVLEEYIAQALCQFRLGQHMV
jgi:hypothetical protein